NHHELLENGADIVVTDLSEITLQKVEEEFAKRQASSALEEDLDNLVSRMEADKIVFVFDMDDTLTQSRKEIPDYNLDLLERLLGRFTVAILSSSDEPALKKQVMDAFMKRNPGNLLKNMIILPTNGRKALVYNVNAATHVLAYYYSLEEKIGKNQKELLFGIIKEAVKEYGIEGVFRQYRGCEPVSSEEFIDDRGTQVTLQVLGKTADAAQKLAYYNEYDLKNEHRVRIKKFLEDLAAEKNIEVEFSIGGKSSIDITPKGINKGFGVDILENKFGIEAKNIIFIGDGFAKDGNDVPVALKAIGFAINVGDEIDGSIVFNAVVMQSEIKGPQGAREMTERILKIIENKKIEGSSSPMNENGVTFNINSPWPMTDEQVEKVKLILTTSYKNMAEAARILREENRKVKVWMLFAIYKETERIQPQGESNPHGEDALRVKIGQLENIFAPYKDVLDWRLVMVDNRCPDNTGKVAIDMLSADPKYRHFVESGNFRVVRVAEGALVMQKGGTLLYGLKELLSDFSNDDLIGYTDCDTTVRLDQLGLLTYPLIINNEGVAMGTRATSEAVALPGPTEEEKKASVELKPIKEYLLHGLLDEVKDTQCGFKLFHLDTVKVIIKYAQDMRWAFDTEWLLLALYSGRTFIQTPICWFDSEALSKTNMLARLGMGADWINQRKRLVDDRNMAHELGYVFGDEKDVNLYSDSLFSEANRFFRLADSLLVKGDYLQARVYYLMAKEIYQRIELSAKSSVRQQATINLGITTSRLNRANKHIKSEEINIYDRNGNSTDRVENYIRAHIKGLWHTSVYMLAITPDGKAYLQVRGEDKYMFPSRRTLSVTGGVDKDESSMQAITREFTEELGIVPAAERLIKIIRNSRLDFDHSVYFNMYEFTAVTAEEELALLQVKHKLETKEAEEPNGLKRILFIYQPVYRTLFVYTFDALKSRILNDYVKEITRETKVTFSDYLLNREWIGLYVYSLTKDEIDKIAPSVEEGITGFVSKDLEEIREDFLRHPEQYTDALLPVFANDVVFGQVKQIVAASSPLTPENIYPASIDAFTAEPTSEQSARLNKYLSNAKIPAGITYKLANDLGQQTAAFNGAKVQFNSRLATIAPEYDESTTTFPSRAFQVFINDIFAQAALYNKGKDVWEVFEERAKYYRDNPEDLMLVTEVFTNGGYDTVSGLNGFVAPNIANKAPNAQKDTFALCYLTRIRMETSLRNVREEIKNNPNGVNYPVARKYFERFSAFNPGSPNWPEGFKASIETNWLVT
ncbi:HAD-IIB family hydrolase, partial [bacterium]